MSAESSQIKLPAFRDTNNPYAGPQQIALAGAVKRSLVSPDASLTLSGPPGVGKTASVRHALDRLGGTCVVARLGRVFLDREDVAEALLEKFDVRTPPASSHQRHAALTHLLKEWADVGTSVFVIVEDVERLGVEALAELESLTAADDDSPGAHLLLLGGADARSYLEHPLLARLRQRVRRNLTLDPFSLEETHGYLEHRMSATGGSCDPVFEPEAVEIIHRCSGGMARVINSLAETMLLVAADTGIQQINAAFASNVARDDFDYDVDAVTAGADGIIDRASDTASNDVVGLEERLSASLSMGDRGRGTEAAIREPSGLHESDSAPAPGMSIPVPGHADSDHDGPFRSDISIEPRTPERLTKSFVPADTLATRALDDALRPDTQFLKTLEDPLTHAPDAGSGPIMPTGPALAGASPTPETREETAGDASNGSASLPTLSNSLHGDALDSSAGDDGAAGNTLPGAVATPGSRINANASAVETPEEPAPSGEEGCIDAAAAGLAKATAQPDHDHGDTVVQVDRPAAAADDELATESPSAPTDDECDNDLPDLATMPEITLDDALDEHQKDARAKLDEERSKIDAAKRDQADDKSGESGAVANESSDEEDRKQRLEALASHFESARSIEDIVDDAAAETLFGEEFSQIAAAVTAMANDAGEAPVEGDPADTVVADANDDDPTIAADDGTAFSADGSEIELSLEPDVQETVDEADSQLETPDATPADGAGPTLPIDAGGSNSNSTADPVESSSHECAATSSPQAPRPKVGLASSAEERLEMVRSLNRQAGKPMPRIPAPAGEEIVLGSDAAPRRQGPAPDPIENQFGLSMTATLKALSAENIKAMQEQEERNEKKKGGFFARFRRS